LNSVLNVSGGLFSLQPTPN